MLQGRFAEEINGNDILFGIDSDTPARLPTGVGVAIKIAKWLVSKYFTREKSEYKKGRVDYPLRLWWCMQKFGETERFLRSQMEITKI